jgi:MFS family permease
MSTAVHGLATKKAIARLVPLLLAAYFMSFIDRSNVGLAKTSLEADVGISATAYGLGAGIFFLSYALLEIPSNLILHKMGPRRWIARIAVTWGVISSAMMFTNDALSFYILRFLLGAAEAGLYPGMMYVVTVWFAQQHRAKVVGYFLMASSAAYAVGNPIGGALMSMDGLLGLQGWQWLFLIEGIPAVLIGVVVWFMLPDRPSDARWLTREEAAVLVEEAGRAGAADQIRGKLSDGFKNPVILCIAGIYFLNQLITYGMVFFVPAVVETLGVQGSFVIGLLAGAVALGSVAGLLVFPRLLRRYGKEVPLIALASFGLVVVGAAFLALSAPVAKYLMLVLSAFLFTGVLPMYWSLAMARVSGKMAAGVLAFINTIGLTGGFVGPYLFGIAEDITGSAAAGLIVVVIAAAVSLLLIPPLVVSLRRGVRVEEVVAPATT